MNAKPVFIPIKENNKFNVDSNTDPANSSKLVRDYKDIKEFSVFGWTKVHKVNTLGKADWTLFFRFTIN